MKLISLHIEHFGGLSDFDLQFEDGLTVVCQPNGFGKTTLAEFIRAMFYGFPRKGKTLDKSKRQKYTPWNGGKCGGNLVFEVQGQRYRLERTFGATPKNDTFALFDLQNNKKSERFSEEIGLELFKLDAESFERSTYLPQIHDMDSLTTDSIQAKLGNLVEDANDMGSFDKAVNALKTARSGYIPYRGNGGAVAEAQGQVTRLQQELERIHQLDASWDGNEEMIRELESRYTETKENTEKVRTKILNAAQAAAVEAAHRQHNELAAELEQGKMAQVSILNRYPQGLPEWDALVEIRQIADELPLLEGRAAATEAELAAERYLADNGDAFAAGLPGGEELETCRRQISDLQQLRAEWEVAGLSDVEKEQYEKLLALKRTGALEEDRLTELDAKERSLAKLRHEEENVRLSSEDEEKCRKLKAYFAAGVPRETELERHQKMLEEAENLRKENGALAAKLVAQVERKSPLTVILPAVLALVGIGLGAVLIVLESRVPGLCALVVGAISLVGAVIALCLQTSAAGKEKSRQQTIREEMARHQQKLEILEDGVRDFSAAYSRRENLRDGLYEIRDNRAEWESLSGRVRDLEEKRSQIVRAADVLAGELRRALGAEPFAQALMELCVAKAQLQELEAELVEADEKRSHLGAKMAELEDQIRNFLERYCTKCAPEEFHTQLSKLQRDVDAWVNARDQVDAWQIRRDQQLERMERLQQKINGFFDDLGLEQTGGLREQLAAIRGDLRKAEELRTELEALTAKLQRFEEEHRQELNAPVSQQREDLDQLRREEATLQILQDEISGELLSRNQMRNQLRQQMDQEGELQTKLEMWQEKRAEGKEKARILDDTLTFLEKAREKLQTSYLGPVREAFGGYMQRLMDEDPENILLNTELEVNLERGGQARELGYFSAGQTDTVMLCMRLALVDALYPENAPLLILDDPFVNLDDARTRQALALLRDIAEEKQILYLVCNSSRTL